MREQDAVLKDETDAAPVGGNARHVRAVEDDAPSVGTLQTGDDAKQCRLPGAARAEQRERLAARHLDVDTAQDLLAGERHVDRFDPDHRRHPRTLVTRAATSATTTVSAISVTLSAIA